MLSDMELSRVSGLELANQRSLRFKASVHAYSANMIPQDFHHGVRIQGSIIAMFVQKTRPECLPRSRRQHDSSFAKDLGEIQLTLAILKSPLNGMLVEIRRVQGVLCSNGSAIGNVAHPTCNSLHHRVTPCRFQNVGLMRR